MNASPAPSPPDPWLDSASVQRQVLAALEEGVAVLDRELRIQCWNATLECLSGLVAAAVQGRRWFDVAAGSDVAGLRPALERALGGTASRLAQLCLKFPETQAAGWFTVAVNPLRGEGGAVAGVILVLRETPVARNGDWVLRDGPPPVVKPDPTCTVEMLQSLLDASPDTILLLDGQGRILALNQTAAARLGRAQPELVGRPIADFLPPVVARLRYARAEQVLASGQPAIFEDQRAGHWLENTFFPVKGPDGQARWLGAISRDITERKRAEESLAVLKNAVDSSINGVAIATPDGRLSYVNRAFLRLWGCEQEAEVLGRPAASFWQSDELPARVMATTLQAGFWVGEMVAKRKDGSRFDAQLATSAVRNQAGEVMAIMASFLDVTERKQAEARLKSINDNLPHGMVYQVIREADGRRKFTYLSEKVREFYGITPEQGLADASLIYGRVHPEDRARVLELEEAANASLSLFRIEVRVLRPDQSVRWSYFVSTPRQLEEGTTCWDGIELDVTDRKRAEEALRASEARFRAVFENSLDAIGVAKQGCHAFVNPAYLALFGYGSSEELVGRSILDLIAPSEREQIAKKVRRRAAGEAVPTIYETRGLRKDGAEFEMEVYVSHFEMQGEKLTMVVLRNITPRKMAEQALRESETRLRFLFENLRDTISRHAPDSTFTYVSPACRELTGFAPEELEGRRATEFVHPEDLEGVIQTILGAVAERRPEYRVTHRMRRRDGDYVWVETLGRLVYDAAGQLAEIQCAVRDVSGRKQVEAEVLRRLELERAIAGIAARFAGSELQTAIATSLADVGRLAGARRALLVQLDERLEMADCTQEWCAEGVESHQAALRGLPASRFAWGLERFGRDEAVLIVDSAVEEGLPLAERELLRTLGVGSVLALPVRGQHRLAGCLCLSAAAGRQWTPDEMALLGVFAQILAVALEREQAEAELRRSENFSRTVIETASSGLVALDRRLRCVLWNPYMERITGLAAAEVLGQGDAELLLVRDDAQGRPAERALAGEVVACGDTPYVVPRTGKGGWLTGTYSPLRSGSGEIIGVLGSVVDITERKRAEAALRESEEKYRALIETTATGFVIVDLEGRVMDANPEYVRLAGRRELAEILGRPVLEWTAAHDVERNAEAVRRCVEQGFIRNLEVDYVDPAGRLTPLEINATVFRTPTGTSIVSLCRDIRERRAIEDHLRQSEERFRLAFEEAPMGVCMIGLDGRLLRVNRAMSAMFGYGADELVGVHFSQVTHPQDLPGSEERYQRVLAGTLPGFEIEKRYVSKAGQIIWAFVRVNLIRGLERQPLYFLGHILDITARKQAEERLRQTGERMRALAARIETVREEERTQIAREIHDNLGQTLTSLKLDLAWLAGRLQADQAALRARAAEMASLLDGAVDTVRRVSSDLRPGVLDDLGLAEAVEWQAQEFERRTGLPCVCHCTRGVDALAPRPATALFRILQEALTNIIRHAHASRVSVRLFRERGLAVLEVADNGRGITKEELSRPGSLGLLSMRERAFAFGGEVRIQGRKGRGTTVRAWLPLGGEESAETAIAAASLLAEAGQSRPQPRRRRRK